MTKEEAKKLTIEVWQYLADQPEIRRKKNLPDYLFKKIKYFFGECALCEYVRDDCNTCPLENETFFGCFYFGKWIESKTKKDRKKAAQKIVDLVKEW